jgi:hypothetical protein
MNKIKIKKNKNKKITIKKQRNQFKKYHQDNKNQIIIFYLYRV